MKHPPPSAAVLWFMNIHERKPREKKKKNKKYHSSQYSTHVRQTCTLVGAKNFKRAENEKISSWVILFVQKVKKKISPNKDLADSCYHKGSIGVKDLLQAKWAIVKFIQRLTCRQNEDIVVMRDSLGKCIKQHSEIKSIFRQ